MFTSPLTLLPGLDSIQTEPAADFSHREEEYYLSPDVEATPPFSFPSAGPHFVLPISLKKFYQEFLMFQALSYGDE